MSKNWTDLACASFFLIFRPWSPHLDPNQAFLPGKRNHDGSREDNDDCVDVVAPMMTSLSTSSPLTSQSSSSGTRTSSGSSGPSTSSTTTNNIQWNVSEYNWKSSGYSTVFGGLVLIKIGRLVHDISTMPVFETKKRYFTV